MKPIARERLVSDLLCLGIAPGDCVMLHSSLSRIGHVGGTFSAVLLPDLPGMLGWDSSDLYSSGTLMTVSPGAAHGTALTAHIDVLF